uniref:ATP-dependent DNA helicase II subunit 2 n=1 Tax=Rhipicephalus appendiculatus TaxID=34631 RepID=A0A131Z019_RHIAP
MAANKEAVAIILDVGPHMNQGPPDGPTDLQEAKTCAELMIQRRIFSESKDEVAVVICGSERTNNSLSSDDEYQNIDVLCGLQPVSFDMLEKLAEVEATKHVCDFVDAIVVALDVIVDKTKNLKFSSRRVVLLSNLGGTFNDSQQSIIAEGMKNSDLSLTIVCPFDVQDIGDDLGKLSAGQQKAVKYVGRILEAVNGDSYTFSQAMPALMSYEKKRTRPTPWNANLEIGPDISIPISSYIKVVEVKPKPWKQCVAKRPAVPVRCDTVYYRNDEKESEVEKDGTIPAYRYGSTLVPFTDENRAAMEGSKAGSGRGLQVLGFTDEANIKRHYYMGDKTSYVVARKGDESAGAALSALIQALKKSKMVAIVRYAFSDKSAPRMGFLSPRIKERYECLVFIQLPYMEDLRRFTFLPLDTNKDNIPTDTQLSLFDDLIAAMDLTAVDIDGEPEELFKSSQTSNPYLQRLYQCIQHRAMHPKDPLPPTPQYIADAIKTPKAVSELAEPVLKKIAAAFPLEEVAPVKVPQDNGVGPSDQSKDHVSNSDEPASKRARTDVSMADLVATATTKVDVVNPVEDFKKLVSGKDHSYSEVCEQLEEVILKLFKDALGRAAHGKAVQCLRAYRESALEKSNPNMFNTFLKKLKELYSGDQDDVWNLLAKEAVPPIAKKECDRSTWPDGEVENFYAAEKQNADKEEQPAKDEDDLLDMM